MTIFAVIQNSSVVNKIIAESKEIAEAITGSSCIELENDFVAEIGSLYLNNEFTSAPPHASWTYDQASSEWVAPVPMPEDGNSYTWSEEDLNWTIVTE